MNITLSKSRLQGIIDALDYGRHITCIDEGFDRGDAELLAVDGAAMAMLMFRREAGQIETTDQPLRHDRRIPFNTLSPRLAKALNFAVEKASMAINGCYGLDRYGEDAEWTVEVYDDRAKFRICNVRGRDEDEEHDAPDDDPDGEPETAPTGGEKAGGTGCQAPSVTRATDDSNIPTSGVDRAPGSAETLADKPTSGTRSPKACQCLCCMSADQKRDDEAHPRHPVRRLARLRVAGLLDERNERKAIA